MIIKNSKLYICLVLLLFSFLTIKSVQAAFLEWDHTALKNINMNNFWLSGSGINDGILINSSNSIGIGLTNPRQKLDVAGYVRGSNGLCIKNDCRTSWPSDVGSIQTFWSQSSLGIYTFNNVAINRNNPMYALHVNGGGAFSGTVEVATPISDFHATTKKYVDDAILAASLGNPSGVGGDSYWSLLNNHIYNNNSGNVGIGVNNPKEKLNIVGGILAEGSVGSTPISGAGTRFMWIPEKNSLRAGRVSGSQWDNNNIGSDSIALGVNTIASGPSSIAIGAGAQSSGYWSVALGQGTKALTAGDFAAGSLTEARGGQSFAMGASSVASGWGSVAMGVTSGANNHYTFAAGRSALASGVAAVAIGMEVRASGNSSFAFGRYVNSAADYSITIGRGVTDQNYLTNNVSESLMVGWGSSPNLFVSTAGAGINTVNITPGIALEVNGKVRASEFVTASDKNLKTNIKKLDGSLEKIVKLQGVSFDWHTGGEKQLGFIAQDVEKIFPEVVFGQEGEKGISYSALIAPIIEAMKEQQIMINQQQEMINQQQDMINSLNKKLNLLIK